MSEFCGSCGERRDRIVRSGPESTSRGISVGAQYPTAVSAGVSMSKTESQVEESHCVNPTCDQSTKVVWTDLDRVSDNIEFSEQHTLEHVDEARLERIEAMLEHHQREFHTTDPEDLSEAAAQEFVEGAQKWQSRVMGGLDDVRSSLGGVIDANRIKNTIADLDQDKIESIATVVEAGKQAYDLKEGNVDGLDDLDALAETGKMAASKGADYLAEAGDEVEQTTDRIEAATDGGDDVTGDDAAPAATTDDAPGPDPDSAGQTGPSEPGSVDAVDEQSSDEAKASSADEFGASAAEAEDANAETKASSAEEFGSSDAETGEANAETKASGADEFGTDDAEVENERSTAAEADSQHTVH